MKAGATGDHVKQGAIMQSCETISQTSFEAREAVAGKSGRMVRLVRLLSHGVRPHDVAALRDMLDETGGLTRAEADALVAVEAADAPKCEEWAAFFIDAVTDHVVWQSRPTGVVNEAQGEWAVAMADRCGTPTALGALANIVAEAHRSPMWFVAAARARLGRAAPAAELSRVA